MKNLGRRSAFARLSLSSGRSIGTEQDFIEWIKSFQSAADRALIDWVCETLELDIGGYLKVHEPFMSLDELRILGLFDGFTLGAHQKSPFVGTSFGGGDRAGDCRILPYLSGGLLELQVYRLLFHILEMV